MGGYDKGFYGNVLSVKGIIESSIFVKYFKWVKYAKENVIYKTKNQLQDKNLW